MKGGLSDQEQERHRPRQRSAVGQEVPLPSQAPTDCCPFRKRSLAGVCAYSRENPGPGGRGSANGGRRPSKLPAKYGPPQSRRLLSLLRTDSLPFVSKIYWPENADDAIMDAPEWLEHIGFAKFAPALREDPGGCESADHPKIARTAEGRARSKSPVWFRLGRLRENPTDAKGWGRNSGPPFQTALRNMVRLSPAHSGKTPGQRRRRAENEKF